VEDEQKFHEQKDGIDESYEKGIRADELD